MSDYWRAMAPGANYTQLNDRLKGLPDYLRKQQIAAPTGTPNSDSLEAIGAEPRATRKAILSSFPGAAKLLGASQQEVDEALDWRRRHDAAQKAAGGKVIAEKPVYGNIVSGTAGAISGATLGATDAAARLTGQREQLERLKKQYPTAYTIGNIAGNVGTAVALPGAGAALAAKGGWTAGKTLLPLLARAGLNAATTAVPTAVFQGLSSGNVTQTFQDFKNNMLWGIIGGTVAEKVFSSIPKLAQATKNVADDLVVSSAGVNAKALRSVAGGGTLGKKGINAQHIKDLKAGLADIITKNHLQGKQVIEDFVKGGGELWDVIDDAFRASGTKPSQFLDTILGDPKIQILLNDPKFGQTIGGYIQDTLMRGDAFVDLAAKTPKMNPLYEIRTMLTNTIKQGFASGADDTARLSADAAESIKGIIDAKFVPVELKAAWPAMKLLEAATARMEAGVSKPIVAGSASAPRMMLQRLMKGAGGGAGIGGIQAAREIDWDDPSTIPPALAKMGLYTIGGALANTALAKLGNRLTGSAAGAMRNIIPAISPAAASGFEKVGSKVGEKLAETIGTGAFGRTTPPTAAGEQGVVEQPVSPQDQATTQTEAQTEPSQIAAAREKVNSAYSERVMQALQTDWVNTFAGPFAQLGLKYDDFVQMVGGITGGFDDPKKTARILFHNPEERDKFLRDYDAALRFGQQDVGSALEYASPQGMISSLLSPKPETKSRAYQDLIDYFLSLNPLAKLGQSEADRTRIEKEIKSIAKEKIPLSQKQKLIEKILMKYGIDLARLQGMGLYG